MEATQSVRNLWKPRPYSALESRERATVNLAENDMVGCLIDLAITTARSRHALMARRAARRKWRQVIGSLHENGGIRPQLIANRLIYTYACVHPFRVWTELFERVCTARG